MSANPNTDKPPVAGGGRPRRRASVVTVRDGRLLAVRLRDPSTGVVEAYLPGGAIEAGETAAAAAARETREETGYAAVIVPTSEIVARYPFTWDGQPFDCTTHFFAATLVDGAAAAVHDAAYNLGVAWVPVEDIPARFGYHRDILRCVLALLPSAAR